MSTALNPPPHWPEPPRSDWTPPPGWQPDRSWGAVPAGWHLWVQDPQVPTAPAPLTASEEIPASGARLRPRADQYPVTVLNPGIWTDNPLEAEDYGFPPEKLRRRRPRLRLALRILVSVLGFVIAGLTALLFVRLVDLAQHDLPTAALAPTAVLSATVMTPL